MRTDLRQCVVIALGTLIYLSVRAHAAQAGDFTASVLFPINLPSGFTSDSISTQPTGIAGGQVVGSGVIAATAGYSHALLWTVSGPIDLHPTNLTGFAYSTAYATTGSQQVGYGYAADGTMTHALLWTGSAGTAVDLNPTNLPNFSVSTAFGTNGSQQVGYGFLSTGGGTHALLWNGSANTAVDLAPTRLAQISSSVALNTNGSQQVGYGGAPGNNAHALLWNGTAQSAVDLEPTELPTFTQSYAYATNGSQQGGVGYLGTFPHFFRHALLWSGAADTAVDLNPTNLPNLFESEISGMNATEQVGTGFGGINQHALLWNGTPDSVVDLNNFLPSTGAWKTSSAYAIDQSGNVYGTAFGTFNNTTGNFAVEWIPVPEPATATCFLAIAAAAFLRRRP